jgi:hypothetical protein
MKSSTYAFPVVNVPNQTKAGDGMRTLVAIGLARQSIPFNFYNSAKVVAVLRGEDMVEVGPDRKALEFEDLKVIRPDSIEHIQWDPIPQISPISADQLQRLNRLITVTRKPSRKITRSVKAPAAADGRHSE